MSYAHDIRGEAKDLARTATNNVIDTATDLADKAGSTLEQAKSKAGAVASEALSKGREAGQQIEQVAGNIKGAIDKSVHEQPLTTLAVAAMMGFVLGAIWKS